jgi:hypothetical protein
MTTGHGMPVVPLFSQQTGGNVKSRVCFELVGRVAVDQGFDYPASAITTKATNGALTALSVEVEHNRLVNLVLLHPNCHRQVHYAPDSTTASTRPARGVGHA